MKKSAHQRAYEKFGSQDRRPVTRPVRSLSDFLRRPEWQGSQISSDGETVFVKHPSGAEARLKVSALMGLAS